MSTNDTQEELKRQALKNLAESRVEIVEGIQQLRTDLSPKLLLQRFVDRHRVAIVSVALGVGVATSILVLRRWRSSRLKQNPKPSIANQSVRQPKIATRLLGGLAGTLLPALLKSGVNSVLKGSGLKQGQHDKPQDKAKR